MVRPYVAAFAYPLGGFTDFHRIGMPAGSGIRTDGAVTV
jgi:hypothetical protein